MLCTAKSESFHAAMFRVVRFESFREKCHVCLVRCSRGVHRKEGNTSALHPLHPFSSFAIFKKRSWESVDLSRICLFRKLLTLTFLTFPFMLHLCSPRTWICTALLFDRISLEAALPEGTPLREAGLSIRADSLLLVSNSLQSLKLKKVKLRGIKILAMCTHADVFILKRTSFLHFKS